MNELISKMTIKNKDVSTVHQSRCGIFQPTRRPVTRTVTTITKWGSSRVKGRIGQNNQDVLDACFAVAEKRIEAEDGRVFLQIDPYLLRKKLGGLPAEKIMEWLQELRSASIELKINTANSKTWILAGILDEAVYSSKIINATAKPGVITAGERHYLRIVVSRTWAAMMSADLQTNYKGNLEAIMGLKSGLSQAIARLMLSHSGAVQMSLEKALDSVGFKDKHRNTDRALALVKADTLALGKMGVSIDDGLVKFSTPASPVPGKR